MEGRYELHHSSQSRHHSHNPTVVVDSGYNHHGHNPTVVVDSGYNHHGHKPPVLVDSRPYSRWGYVPSHYNGHTYRWGVGATLIAALIFVPIVIVALIANTAVTAMSMATAGTVGATATGSALALSAAATFGLGVLIAYGVIGLGCLYSSAKECYSGDKNVIEMIKSRVVNEDGASFKGVMKSIGAVLWSPFLLVGGLSGMGAKAAVAAYHRSKSSVPLQEGEQLLKTSHEQMGSDLAAKKSGKEVVSDQIPVQLSSIYSGSLKVPATKESEEVLGEQHGSHLTLTSSSNL